LATVIASADAGRGLEGYIDVSGNLVIPPRFDHANPFSDGVAQVEINERWGYINKDGTFAISARFLRARSFNEGRAWVIIEGPCQMDYPICGEKLALPPSTVTGIHSLAFQTPAAIERLRALPVCKYALIDKSGTIMTSLRFVESQDFSEGLAAVTVGKLWGYVNRDGTMAIPPTLVVAGNFSEGLAAAIRSDQPSDSGFGFIDRSGSFVIKPQFQGAQPFSEGLAVVSDGKRYWYIDHEGRNPFSKTFEAAGSFFKGLAHVKTAPGKPDRASNGTFAYINRSGKAVFTYQNQEKD
jgi:hypothetical protein